jgi:putative peptidoglycan lipid II flippase
MASAAGTGKPTLLSRALRALRPTHEHSAYSATLLLMAAIMLSRVIGYLREAYIAYAFGAGPTTDAYVAAFTLPDWVNYMLAGGTASITFISIFTRYTSEGREEDALKAFSTVITVMSVVLAFFIVVAEFFTPQFTRWWFPDFTPHQIDLCVFLTRVLLPGQLFFIIGGVVSAVLLSRRMFLIPALAPVLYNLGIILGGVFLARRFGVASLAYGALAGAFVGPFFINVIGAARTGVKYRPSFDFRHPGFIEWLAMSIPLMLGVSLVAADDWIMRHFASGGSGDITRLNYAKRLFAVPIAVLGQAAGQASLPFFAKLFGEGKRNDFSRLVNASIFRISAASILTSGLMCVTAFPVIDLVYRRGHFNLADSHQTAIYFFWFALSLAFWSAQGLYARAYYAAGQTLKPMLASTIITVLSIPVYSALFHRFGAPGLAMASDIGIVANTVVLAVLLHQSSLVRAGDLPWGELGKVLLTAAIAAAAGWAVHAVVRGASRKVELSEIVLISLTWTAAVAGGLWITRSILPQELRRKRKAPAQAGANGGGAAVTTMEP